MASTSLLSNAGMTLLNTDPVTVDDSTHESSLDPSNIFNVDGLVAVVTGGGTGRCMVVITPPSYC